jgi:adenylate cyclase
MAKEIERKFLVKTLPDLTQFSSASIEQGYLADGNATVRVRVLNETGFITIKCNGTGMSVDEYEYQIPFVDAQELLTTCKVTLKKSRYYINELGHTFELDVFAGHLNGLIVAEVELEAEDEHVSIPDWLGEEVTGISAYYNKNLIKNGIPNG